MTKCGDLGEISTRNLQLGEIDLKEHTYRKFSDAGTRGARGAAGPPNIWQIS